MATTAVGRPVATPPVGCDTESRPVVAAPISAVRARRAWTDNLRVTVIVGVIAAHVATTYVLDIDWYYQEYTAHAVTEAVVAGLFVVGVMFGMGLLFLVAGLLTPPALARKGTRRFVHDRLLRLGVPLVVFVAVIDPATDFLGYRGEGGDDGLVTYLGRWWHESADLGPMWFVAALLAFSVVTAAWRARHPAAGARTELGARQLVRLAAGIAVASFAVRLVWPTLSNAVLGLNLWEFPQMIAMFAFGVVAAERGWLADGIPDRLWRGSAHAALAGAAVVVTVAGALLVSSDEDRFLGGLRVEALAIPVGEAVLAVSLSLWVLEWYRRKWDRSSRLSRAMARASYPAYVLHPPVVVALSVALRSLPVPAEIKFVVVSVLGVAIAFTAGWLVKCCRALAAKAVTVSAWPRRSSAPSRRSRSRRRSG